MKLRNKKTRETVKVVGFDQSYDEIKMRFVNEDNVGKLYITDSLTTFNSDWEDYKEEPKEYYAIDLQGDIIRWARHSWDEQTTNKIKAIGNYFETEEEAEKAVEKLKAWKRLKDNGYKFNGVGVEYDGYKIYLKCDIMKKEHYTPTQDHKDLDLLFGGEE